jgi:hypothetical protein
MQPNTEVKVKMLQNVPGVFSGSCAVERCIDRQRAGLKQPEGLCGDLASAELKMYRESFGSF